MKTKKHDKETDNLEGGCSYTLQNLIGQSFKNHKKAYANFQGSDIRSASFSSACLIKSNFALAKAGISPRREKILLAICLCLTFISGYISGFSSFLPLFIRNRLIEGVTSEKIVFLIISLLIIAIFSFLLLKKGLGRSLVYLSLASLCFVIATIALGSSDITAIALVQAMILTGYVSIFLITALIINVSLLVFERRFVSLAILVCSYIIGMGPGIVEATGITEGEEITSPAFDISVASLTALSIILISTFLAYRACRGDPKYSLIQSLATSICSKFSTNFRKANLSGADFTKADLKHTDLCDANVSKVKWIGSKNIHLAKFNQPSLANPIIRELMISGDGQSGCYDHLDLQDVDFSGFQLSNCSFVGANLSNANLTGANLTGAKLVQTQLYRAQLNKTCLTGAYIQDWGISPDTQFSDIECAFIYMRLPTPTDPDACRKPDNKQETFEPGDFETFITPIIKTLDLYQQQNVDPRQMATTYRTVDLFHHEGIDPSAAAIALKQLAELHPEANLEVVALEGRGDDKIRLQARVADQADRSQISAEYFERYQKAAELPYGDLQSLLAAMSEKDKRIQSLENMVTTAVQSEKFYVETYYDFGTLQSAPDKTILILTANPENINQRRLDAEVRAIQAGLERSKDRDQFQIITKWAVRTEDLRRALLDYEPQIVQFSGYGSATEGLMLENEAGQIQFVSVAALTSLFKFFSDRVECVFLNACYSVEQANAISQHIPYVIGMTQQIGDRTALNFAVGFYDALGVGRSIEEAFEVGCISIDLEGMPDSWIPVLKKSAGSEQPE